MSVGEVSVGEVSVEEVSGNHYSYYVESRNFNSCMYTFKFIPKNPEHLDGLPKRPENPDCEVPIYIHRDVYFTRELIHVKL